MAKGGPVVQRQPVAWQYLGPGPRHGEISSTEPAWPSQHWYPLFRSDNPLVEAEEMQCSVCGRLESQNGGQALAAVRVIVAEGEAGWADVTQLLCYEHFGPMQAALKALGFAAHQHGALNYLEADCPGANGKSADCPTPSDFGAVIVQPKASQ